MRLIDADKLIMNLYDWWYSTFKGRENERSIAIRTVIDKVEKYVTDAPTIEPNLVINPEEVAEGRVIEIGEDIIVMHHKDYYDMFLKSELYDDIKPCEDAINREWLMKEATVKFYTTNYFSHITEMIENAPTVAPSRPSGEWIGKGDYEAISVKCSICGRDNGLNASNFCPNCGAKMSKESE